MTSGLRLSRTGIEPAGKTLSFMFDGVEVAAIDGETIAAALAAAGQIELRQAGPHERRGVFCGMGVCQDCLVEIDGRGSQRACMTKAKAGLDVRRHDPAHSRLAPLARRPQAPPRIEMCEVAIVGAGPAALSAARVLGGAGVRPILIDERDLAGGQFFKPLAPSYRFSSRALDSQSEQGRILVKQVRELGGDIRSGQTVWHASITTGGRAELGVAANTQAYILSASAVLLATGAYERPHHVPGWTLPGVMTTGAAQTLARAYRVSPGRRVVVAGNGPLNWQVALEIARGGGTVIAVLESARPTRPGALAALVSMVSASPKLAFAGLRLRADLAMAGIPIHEGVVVSQLRGNGKVEQVIARRSDGSELAFDADAVCLGYGFTPSVDVLRMLGGPVSVDPDGFPLPLLDGDGRSATGPVWVAGDGGAIGGSQVAMAQGALAAHAILASLGKPVPDRSGAADQLARARRFQGNLWSLFAPQVQPPESPAETIICRCEGVSASQIASAGADGVADLGSLKRHTRLGMGRCQGRYCAAKALQMLRGDLTGASEADLFAPQAPTRPVPAMLLANEKGEWAGHREVGTSVTPRGAHRADPLPSRCDLLVIGAGITGAATALFAARNGMDVVVVDRSAPNSQASGGNAGSLHVQLLSWDFGKKAMAGGSPALHTLPLQRDSVALWKALELELQADFEIVTTGGLMVAENADQTQFLRDKVDAEQRAGIQTEVIGRSELASLAPALAQTTIVAAYCPAEGKINPLKATPAIVGAAMAHGARFGAGHDITGIQADGEGYRVTSAAGATISCRRLVIAAGGWSRQLGRMLGAELPISGAPLQMLVTEPTRPILKQLVAHADRHLTMKQASNGNLIIGGAWTADTNSQTGYARVLRDSIEGNLWVAERTIPAVAGLHLLRSWAAMNINIDGAPLLGPIAGHPNAFIAATANGYTLGPIMGQITAALAAGRDAGRGLEGFTLARF
ncbi:FAD-dependent pyridine nucleotide-disulfide oxidoreductase [Devosia sp. LC5]|uniref:FAD-dependent oxidoreductase n=1 Tax=Devosia sp. LC5 TaxID=1502724 RepID=UPI0004E2ED02|nr:FAD-dependent oxidoreductase [Devosia sp. LC5]KFC64540.1 FAD-dependent pyridine nucleotide-disulfide oxidoreductase [Devosia sp. LC5]